MGVCVQQRRRLACESVQYYQRLCCSLIGKYHIKTCYKRNFTILASLCSSAGWIGYDLVGNPNDKFSRLAAHMMERELIFLSPKVSNKASFASTDERSDFNVHRLFYGNNMCTQGAFFFIFGESGCISSNIKFTVS